MMRATAAVVVVVLACGGGKGKPPPLTAPIEAPVTRADKLLALLPPGAQIVIELDLARLRANPVVGTVVTKVVGAAHVELPEALQAGTERGPVSPLAVAELVVLAAYGVGTSNAAMVSLIASTEPVADATQLGDGVYVLGPVEWIGQVEQRRVLSLGATGIHAERELLELRDRSMPTAAPGASLRITARLPFDARVALARQTGLESAPAQLSVWADVVDDFVIIVDADAADPGEKKPKRAIARLEKLIRVALRTLAQAPEVRALGLPSSLGRARLAVKGTWIRTIVAVGPTHLQRVVGRATQLIDASPAAAPEPSPAAGAPAS